MASNTDQRTVEIVLKAQDANASLKEMSAGAAVMTAQLRRMGQDDPGRAQLLADLQDMNQRLRDGNAAMRAVVKTEEELAAEATAAAAAVQELARANQQTVATGQQATASLNQMRAAASLMEQELAAMSADDPGRARLQQDFATLTQRIGTTSSAMRTQVMTAEQLAQAQAQVAEENVRLVVNGQRVAASFHDMSAASQVLERQLHAMSADDPGRAQLLADYRALQQRIADVRSELGPATVETGKFKQMLGLVGVAFTAEAAIEGISSIGKAIFSTTAKFETYAVVMKNALGSESEAQLALHDLQTMAAQTPFSVDELTSSFLKFVNRGLKPSMAEMTKMADLAASQGKSFDQLAEAVLDAATGEFERLKEFGIQASKSGNAVSLSFKGVQKTVANTPEAINAALVSFGELKGVMGGTAAISQTLDGSVSNLGDTADMVAIQYGQGLKPVFVAVISTLGFLLGLLGALPGFLRDNRGALLALAGAVMTFNAPMIQANALLLYNAALAKGKVVWDWAVAASTRAWTIAQNGLNLALSANPIGAVIAVGTLLVGLFVLLYDKSEKVRAGVAGLGAAFMAFVTTVKNGVLQNLTGLGDLLVGIFTMNPAKIKKGMEEIGGAIKAIYYDSGKNAAAAFSKGYDEKLASEQEKSGSSFDQIYAKLQAKMSKQAEEASKKRLAAEAASRLQGLQNEEADLKVRLARAEDGSRVEMKLKQQLLGVQAKIELEDAKKTENDKRVIRAEAQGKIQDLEADYNKKVAKQREEERKKLAKLAEAASKAELEVQKQVDDLRVAVIKDKYAREIAEINLQTDRKMAAIKGSEEQQMEQWSLLEQERWDEIAAVNAKRAEDEAKQAEETAAKKAEIQAADDELFLANLQNRVALGLATEQEYQDALYQLQQEGLAQRLQQRVDAGQGESVEAKKIRAALLKGQAEYIQTSHKQDQGKVDMDSAMANLNKRMNAEGVADLLANLDKKGAAYKAYALIRKAMALWEIQTNLFTEMSENAKQSAAFPPPFNAIYLVGADILSGIRAGAAIAKVVAFAKGGDTTKGKDMVGGQELLRLLSGVSGGGQAPNGSFAGGGVVPSAQIGLIGEAGAELVIPNWLFTDPKQANIMGYLEAQIAGRGNAFADGGRTADRGGAATSAPAAGGDDAMLGLMRQMVQGQREFREEISGWQRELEVNLNLVETKKGLDVVAKVQSGGGIK